MNEFSFVAEEIAETFMKAKDAHLLMAQDCFQNYTKPVHLSNRLWIIVYFEHWFVSFEKMIEQIENPDPDQTEEQRDEIITDTRKVAQCVLDGNRYQGIGQPFK